MSDTIQNPDNDFIIHHVERKDGRWRISYERRSEWKPRTVFLDDLLAELDAKSSAETE